MSKYNKAIYGTIGSFLAMFIVQSVAAYMQQQGTELPADQQAEAINWLSTLITSALVAVMTGAAVYQSPANEG